MKLVFSFLLLVPLTLRAENTPTVLVDQGLEFHDDIDFENLDLAIERQMAAYSRGGLSGTIRFGGKVYQRTILKDSLLLFQKIANDYRNCRKINSLELCKDALNVAMNTSFSIYAPTPSINEPGHQQKATTKFTSYYSPDLHGARVQTEKYPRPIFRKPLPPHDNYTRVDIDYTGALAGKGYEIFWVRESFYDLYLLHVQGGGRMNIDNLDGTTSIKYLSFDGKNTRPFQMIFKYMLEKGYLKPGAAGINEQRKFLEENPDKEEEIFGTTPSYVYFKESDQEPVGVNNIPLTEGRSLAIDNRIYKTMGLINFVKTQKASHIGPDGKVVKTAFSRFFISQDTGGAIRGNARCDLYFGYGPQAEMTAYNMNDMGEQYILIKK